MMVDPRIGKSAKALAQRTAAALSVGLATSGLSSCTDNGAVDPPPPPFACTANTMAGLELDASLARQGTTLTVTIGNFTDSRWTSAGVRNAVNVMVTSLEIAPGSFSTLTLMLELTDETVTGGSFELVATLEGDGISCEVTRRFEFSLADLSIGSTVVPLLPLASRDSACIVALAREGNVLVLAARSDHRGERTVEWTATAGTLEAQPDDSVRWALPEAPGMYQVEVVMDYGDDGVGFDALAVEVALEDSA